MLDANTAYDDRPKGDGLRSPTGRSPAQAHPQATAVGETRRVPLLVATAALLLAGVLAATVIVWQLHRSGMAEARRNTARLGSAVAEQTARSVQAAELLLQRLCHELAPLPGEDAAALAARLAAPRVRTALRARSEELPQVAGLGVTDAGGMLLATSHVAAPERTDLSDREFVRHFQAPGHSELFLGSPVRSRLADRWTVQLARRLAFADGTTAGVVVAALDLDYFEAFYQALAANDDLVIGLRRKNGVLVARFPPLDRMQDGMAPDPELARIATDGGGTYIGTVLGSAPGPRIISVHPLAEYDLAVNVSVSEQQALAGWRRAAAAILLCTGAGVLCSLVLLHALSRQFRQLQAQAAALSRSQATLAQQSAALKTTLGHMNQGILMVDADGTIAVSNTQLADMLDLPAAMLAQRPPFADVVAYQAAQGEFSAPGATLDPEELKRWSRIVSAPASYERRRPDGRVLEVQSIPLADGGMVRTYTDITERRRSEEAARHYAQHDPLTGLANRACFAQRLDQAIADADTTGGGVAVLYLDLDNFKPVNDTHGHAVGDELLVEVAGRLRAVVRAEDTVARIGGDEFAIVHRIAPEEAEADSADFLAQRLQAAAGAAYRIGTARCLVGVSIGIARYPEHATTAVELVRRADVALYRAKAGGKGAFRTYDAEADDRQQRLLLLGQDLRQALPEAQLFLEYQPIACATTGAALRHEALLRWRHPHWGQVSPAEFVPLAEASGLIVQIGLWVLETACAAAAAWPDGAGVSVNLSPVQFTRGDLPEQVAGVLRRTGLAPRRLNLEVTEGVLIEDSERVLQTMSALRGMGVRFSLDDFGTAHAGLTYLRRFPFDVIKIDKSFVQDAPDQEEARVIVDAVLAIGRAFGLAVTAEGVETESQLALMRSMGCAEVQGYLLGRPREEVRPVGRRAGARSSVGADASVGA